MSQPLLSILVPTVPSRVGSYFPDLMENLEKQCQERDDVEVLGFYDNRKRSVGAKRNALLDLAAGKYLVFLDDDDTIHGQYVKLVCEKLLENPTAEVLVYDQVVTVNGEAPKLCRYGIEFAIPNDGPTLYTAHPAHTMPWLTEVARTQRFPDKSFGEDTNWSSQLSKRVTRQARLEEVMYWYAFSHAISETRGIRKTVRVEGQFAKVQSFAQGVAKGTIAVTAHNNLSGDVKPPSAQEHYLERRRKRREQQEAENERVKRSRR